LQPDGRRFLASRVMLYSIKQGGLLEGGALIEDEPSIQQNNGGWIGTVHADGYPLNVTPQTRMLAAPDDTTFIHSVHQHRLTIRAKINPASPERAFSSSLLKPNTWVVYHAVDSGNGSNAASQIRFWPNRASVEETGYLEGFIAKISNDEVTKFPSSIQLRHGNAITILPNRSIQEWVSKVGMGLVPLYQKSLPDSDTTKIHFQFYVVRPFHAPFASGLVDINGVLPYSDGAGGFEYHNPAIFTQVKDVIALPSGLVLIPDQVLASLQNEAQLAALLSCSVTSVLQKQAYLAKHHSNGFYFAALWLRLNEQALRIGIRQMYLAGYDIREAPFAWAVAQGKPVNNPVINSKDPDKEIPWYAAYAFNYISQYYKDVDYSKLKRGEAEYQEFLKKLYKADPTLKQPKAQASKQ